MLAGIADGDPAVARDIRRRVMNTLRREQELGSGVDLFDAS
jgi:hypothetical protein